MDTEIDPRLSDIAEDGFRYRSQLRLQRASAGQTPLSRDPVDAEPPQLRTKPASSLSGKVAANSAAQPKPIHEISPDAKFDFVYLADISFFGLKKAYFLSVLVGHRMMLNTVEETKLTPTEYFRLGSKERNRLKGLSPNTITKYKKELNDLGILHYERDGSKLTDPQHLYFVDLDKLVEIRKTHPTIGPNQRIKAYHDWVDQLNIVPRLVLGWLVDQRPFSRRRGLLRPDGSFPISVSQMVKQLRLTKRSARACIDELSDRGIITFAKRGNNHARILVRVHLEAVSALTVSPNRKRA